MKRSEDRILTTHVGSLIRPDALIAAAKDHGPGNETYERELTRSVADIVAAQAGAGVDVVNDGEFGKSGWADYILERVSGFEKRPDTLYPAVWLGRDRIRFAEFMAEHFPRGVKGTPGRACVGPIVYHGHEQVRRELRNLRAAVDATRVEDAFFTAVAPASVGYDASNEHYAREEDYIFAIAAALREEYLEIINAGFVLQVDDAVLANLYDHLVQEGGSRRFRDWAELRIAALNHALEGIPEDRVRYHVCFGSWHVPHTSDAQLEDIVDLILKVKAGAYSIEAANVRHEHEVYVWDKVKLPAGRMLLPGVVTHHTTVVEHPRLVADRITRFAKAVGRKNVIASTDCGFGQGDRVRRVHPQVMWAKLESLAEGARMASKELW